MKSFISTLIAVIFYSQLMAQVTGDTVVVNTFNYGSQTRDTLINFPNNTALTYEKVLMLYNIRCKNGLVSPGTAGQTNIGCGEWDYSCNTYLTDSSRVDSLGSIRPSHAISNYSGSTYPYITSPYYNLYQYPQTITSPSIISESQYQIGAGTLSLTHVLSAGQQSGRSQYLFTATELSGAGVIAGDIGGLILQALNNSTINFLKIKIKHTSLTVLDAANPDISGFTETYNANTNFITGNNRLQFNTPFNWDGVSNIIIDFSFTNSSPNALLNIQGANTGNTYGLYTGNGYYINTAGGVAAAIPATPFASISNQITITFWSRGNTGISSVNTSILEGTDSAMNRQLNIHLPWSNSRVYFDCGNAGSGYDRIDKAATISEMEQSWNHWAFTKNANTGIMNIYLNGALWHTGSGKTNPINIDSMILGANINLDNAYKGDIDELTIWNAELSAANIAAWMNKSIDMLHPNYTNLVAYYKLNEGTGNTTLDASLNTQNANFGFAPDWKFTRGENLKTLFSETTERPNTIFLQGNYVLLNANSLTLDSLPASGNIVKAYSIISNAGSMQSDVLNTVSTNVYWHAKYRYKYDGLSGTLLDSFTVTPTGTIVINDLSFIDRYPSKYEIMSFVTPYGINLDLGMSGKTWTFDVTDYLPILKGAKKMSVERGGEWQENMDIKFLFIVGTPVHNVKNITQLWRQPGGCNYNDIITEKYFEPRNVLLDPSGKNFKIRTTITGHGQEGEFIPRDHLLNIGGGANEFVWQVYKKCATNPVFPQGGTWVYDRCGWCPGMASDLKESDITPFVTAGTIANIDYGMLPISSPPVGDSRYIVTNQLVTYGDMNFTLDASVIDILAPTNKIEYIREQAICNHPKIVIQNTGSTTLTSLDIEYWINNNTGSKSSFTWTGSLAPLQKQEVELPANMLWVNVNTPNNEFHAEIKNPNGGTDQYSWNNKMNSAFVITDVVPSNFIIYHKSNNAASETHYELFDVNGTQIFTRQPLANQTIYRDTFILPSGCYKFVVTDSDEDGISWWANSDGAGSMKFLKGTGTTLKVFNPDFGASIVYNFTIDYPLSYEQLYEADHVKIFPNPANDQFTIQANDIEKANFILRNSVGQKIDVPFIRSAGKIVFNTRSLWKGVYFVTLTLAGKTTGHKIVIE